MGSMCISRGSAAQRSIQLSYIEWGLSPGARRQPFWHHPPGNAPVPLHFIGGVAVGKLPPTRAFQRSSPRNFLIPPFRGKHILVRIPRRTTYHYPHSASASRITASRGKPPFFLISFSPSPNFYFSLPSRRVPSPFDTHRPNLSALPLEKASHRDSRA